MQHRTEQIIHSIFILFFLMLTPQSLAWGFPLYKRPAPITPPAKRLSLHANTIYNVCSFAVLSYWLYKSLLLNRELNRSIEQSSTVNSDDGINDVMEFFKAQCGALRLKDPELVNLIIDADDPDTSSHLTFIPEDWATMKTNKKKFLICKSSDFISLNTLLLFKKNPSELRNFLIDTHIFRETSTLNFTEKYPLLFKSISLKNIPDIEGVTYFSEAIRQMILIKKEQDTPLNNSPVSINNEKYINFLEQKMKLMDHEDQLKTNQLIIDLKQINGCSDDFLTEVMDDILSSWEATLYHEIGHFKQFPIQDQNLYTNLSLPTLAVLGTYLLDDFVKNNRKIPFKLAGFSLGFCFTYILNKLNKYMKEWDADSMVHHSERHVRGLMMLFSFHGYNEIHSKPTYNPIKMLYRSLKLLTPLYMLTGSTHPSYLARHRNLKKILYRIQLAQARKKYWQEYYSTRA